MKSNLKTILMLAVVPAVFSSCSKNDDTTTTDTTVTLEVKSQSNLFANDSSGHFTFFNLRTNSIVSVSDSATANWDLAFHATTILTNNGTSGPGAGGAAVVTQGFDDVTTAPAESTFSIDNGTALAIPTGSNNGWYYYDTMNNVIIPLAGRTIVIRTADGKYGKLEILSYYKDAPATPTMTDTPRYYKFRFTFQNDGTKNLK